MMGSEDKEEEGKMHDLNILATKNLDKKNYYFGGAIGDDERHQFYKLGKKGAGHHHPDASSIGCNTLSKKRKINEDNYDHAESDHDCLRKLEDVSHGLENARVPDNLDIEKEMFKAQNTSISQSCEEVKANFHKEEVLRYVIPERAFWYTAVDGKKSMVAPLRSRRRSKEARDHFMLKGNRPADVTILCLVRDAAARLPASIGTLADVCTLIRDSQYLVDDVSDAHLNQVVSGALNRLHYERDPCVQFDRDTKLWLYTKRFSG